MIAPHTLANFQSLTKLIASIINAPHTLANFQSLPKLIALIINRFYSHCRGDWQIALTKQNFSDNLPIQNSKFKIQNSQFKNPLQLLKRQF